MEGPRIALIFQLPRTSGPNLGEGEKKNRRLISNAMNPGVIPRYSFVMGPGNTESMMSANIHVVRQRDKLDTKATPATPPFLVRGY